MGYYWKVRRWNYLKCHLKNKLWGEHNMIFTYLWFFLLCALWTWTKVKTLRVRVCLTGLGKYISSLLSSKICTQIFPHPLQRLGKGGLVSFRGQKRILISGQGKWVFLLLGSPCGPFVFNSSRSLITKRAMSQRVL